MIALVRRAAAAWFRIVPAERRVQQAIGKQPLAGQMARGGCFFLLHLPLQEYTASITK
jgi:hypothetical protein